MRKRFSFSLLGLFIIHLFSIGTFAQNETNLNAGANRIGKSGSSDFVLNDKGNLSSNPEATYYIELLPGQVFTGWYYYWALSGTVSANLQESPAVPWLSISPTTFTSTGCDDIIPVEFSFTAPTTPGSYSTTIIDLDSNWSNTVVELLVTNTPTPRDSLILHVNIGQIDTIEFDSQTWDGFGNLGCITNYIPATTISVDLSQYPPVNWLELDPSNYTLNLNETQIVEAIVSADSVGSFFTYVFEVKDWYSYPKWYLVELNTISPITIISPVADEMLGALTEHNILWASDGVNTLRIEYSIDDGNTYFLVAAEVPADSNLYSWEVPPTPSDSCRLKLTDVEDSDNFAISQRFRIGDAIVITYPEEDERWIAGETDTIRWESFGVDSIRILFSREFEDLNSPFDTLAVNYPTQPGFFVWDIPDDILSTKCAIVIDDMKNDLIFSEAKKFRIKGYVLTRLSDGSYEAFDPAVHGWNFGNYPENMWPLDWWDDFDYENGTDPITQRPYPGWWTTWPFDAQPANFPDWPLFVSAYSVDQLYFDVLGTLNYKTGPAMSWFWIKGEWGGSCHGFTISSYLAFNRKAEFLAEFPELPQLFNNVHDLPLEAPERVVINELWIHVTGKLEREYRRDSRNKTAVETLQEIKLMFLEEDPDLQPIYISNLGPNGGAHSINAYKIEKDPLNPDIEYVYVYDNNAPNDQTRRIVVDKVANTWDYSILHGWKSSFLARFFLNLPASNYLNDAILNKTSETAQPLGAKSPEDTMRIVNYHSDLSSILITNVNGEQIGFDENGVVNSIPGAFSIIPITGYPHPPIGFNVPEGLYTVEMKGHSYTSSYFSVRRDTLFLTYGYSDADSLLKDHLHIGDGLSVCFEDSRTKTANFQAIAIGDDAEHTFGVSGLALSQNDSLNFKVIEQSDLTMLNEGSTKSYDLNLRIASTTGKALFEHANITLDSNSLQQISPVWEDLQNQPVTIYIDLGNDGTIDDTLMVVNQVTNVDDRGALGVPHVYKLTQNYPNPFNPETKISYSLPQRSDVTLKVYNILGQEVITLVNEQQPAGNYEVSFDASGLSSGVYFYKIQAGDYVNVRKMILLR